MDYKKYLSKIGKKGGKARAEKNSPEKLSAWGKMGGRPRKLKPSNAGTLGDKQVLSV